MDGISVYINIDILFLFRLVIACRVTFKSCAYSILGRFQVRIQGVGAGAGAHSWDGDSPLNIYHSIAFEHQFITGRSPLGEILYPRLGLTINTDPLLA